MTKRQEKKYREFIKSALMMRHLLNCVPHEPVLTPEEREDCLTYTSLSNECVKFAYRMRRKIWRQWRKERQEERARKKAALKRKKEKQKREREQTR